MKRKRPIQAKATMTAPQLLIEERVVLKIIAFFTVVAATFASVKRRVLATVDAVRQRLAPPAREFFNFVAPAIFWFFTAGRAAYALVHSGVSPPWQRLLARFAAFERAQQIRRDGAARINAIRQAERAERRAQQARIAAYRRARFLKAHPWIGELMAELRYWSWLLADDWAVTRRNWPFRPIARLLSKLATRRSSGPRHPRQLYAFFMVEMWERFGYYLMLAIFTLYLKKHLGYSAAEASSTYGSFIALTYFAPFFGGIIADRWLGYRKAVLFGAALMAVGYFALGAPPKFLWTAIILIVLGNGMFKPSIGTMLGNMYPAGDSRRDAAFSVFYMGVNIGAFFSPFVADYMVAHYGWAAAFSAAGVGMMVGFVIAAACYRWFKLADQRSSVAAVLGVPLPKEYEDAREPPLVEGLRILAISVICVIVIFFWAAFHQNGSVLVFWADDHTRESILGWKPGAIVYNSVNPFFVVTLTPVLNWFFGVFLEKRGRQPSTAAKIGIGMVLTAISYLIMVVGSLAGGNSGRVSPLWLISSYFVVTLAELCLSPMGLALVSKLAPRSGGSGSPGPTTGSSSSWWGCAWCRQ